MWLCVCLWLDSLIYMPCSDMQAYGKSRNRKDPICCLCWKTNKPTDTSRWHRVMLVGGNVLCQFCRQAGALLWMKRRLNIGLGLPHTKQIKHHSFLCAELFIPRWFYLLISSHWKGVCFWQVKVLVACSSGTVSASNRKTKCHQIYLNELYINRNTLQLQF